MADEKRSFDPTEAETNRGREQGLGMGQRELDAQSDPAGAGGIADGVSANPEEDWGEPADEGAVYSSNHATRGQKSEAQRMMQGAKTRHANKDAVSRRV